MGCESARAMLNELPIAASASNTATCSILQDDAPFSVGLGYLPPPFFASAWQVGSDCPDHAIYVDVASVLDTTTAGSQPDALCLFEDDLSETAWRHSNTGGGLVFQKSCKTKL